jgi:hypothetical protein
MINLDEWQKEILAAEGNLCICSGRQVGKSFIIARKAADFVANNRNKSVLIISATERQAEELFLKSMFHLQDNYKKMIKRGRDRPTKSKVQLINGSILRCLPTGVSGLGIRGFTVDMLLVDEAAFIPDEVFAAVTPMLLTTGGSIILVSTPHGRKGYFYEAFNSPTYKSFHVKSLDVIKNRQITESWTERQREYALQHLANEEKRMTKLQFQQEYQGEFVDDLRQLFPDDLIKKCMVMTRRERIIPGREYYIGVDLARMGKDESTFEILDRTDRNNLVQVENVITKKTFLTDSVDMIIKLEDFYHFKKIYIDDSGLGAAVFDFLLKHETTKRKTIGLNNAARSLDVDEKRKKKLLKNDLYANLLRLMERGEIKLLQDPEIFVSLKSVQYEYTESGEMKIFGNYTHVAEGLIRAAWCVADKSLNIWVRFN